MLRFDGKSLLSVPGSVPPAGSLFIVFKSSTRLDRANALLGWEDADVGKHGLGLMTDPSGRLHAILRKNGKSGDIVE